MFGRPPARSLYHKHDYTLSSDRRNLDPLFIENVNDICDTLAQIMIVCGIPAKRAADARPFIAKSFQFYDIKRHQFVVEPEYAGSIRRSYTIKTLRSQTDMTYLEAMLAYDIIKRAIKAFFLHTPERSLRSPITEAILLKEQRFAWQHAASKTIRIFQKYHYLFFASAVNYSDQITELYDILYERIKMRANPVIVKDYFPSGCRKKVIIESRSPVKVNKQLPPYVNDSNQSKELRKYLKELQPKQIPLKPWQDFSGLCSLICDSKPKKHNVEKEPSKLPKKGKEKKAKNVELNLPRWHQCNCPHIICDCNIDPNTGIVAIDSSQGPYQCQWVRMNKAEEQDLYILKPEYHECPVDCLNEDSSSDSDSNYCKCPSDNTDVADCNSNDSFIPYSSSDNDEKLEAAMKKDLPNSTKYKNDRISNDLQKISKVPSIIIKNRQIREKFSREKVRYS